MVATIKDSDLVGVGEVELCGGSAVAQVANPDHLLDQVLGLLEGQVLGAALGLDLVAGSSIRCLTSINCSKYFISSNCSLS